MNFTLAKKNEKGRQDISLIIAPSDNLEKEFFNALFANEAKNVVIETKPNSDDITIRLKTKEKDVTSDLVEDLK